MAQPTFLKERPAAPPAPAAEATVAPEPAACCVDLDGTLVATDLLHESVLTLVRQRPWLLLMLPLWLLRGRSYLKHQVALRARLDPRLLPYRAEVLADLRERAQAGGRLYLTTACNERLAQEVAGHLGLFDGVLASCNGSNLKGPIKLQAIHRELAGRPFEYWGDSRCDVPVWQEAAAVHVVAPSRALDREVRRRFPGARIVAPREARPAALVRLMRPHQWAKNLLLLVPILAAHQVGDIQKWVQLLLGVITFSGCASAVYVLNDLFDLEADRAHREKRLRPLAAGLVAPADALLLASGLLIVSLGAAAALLPNGFWLICASYVLLSLWYSLSLKKLLLVDVIVLAGFYSYRIWAGGAVIDVVLSPWLIGFSTFFFLNLAFLKRYIDLMALSGEGGALHGRDYRVEDADVLRSLGPAAGYLSLVVLAMYINSEAVLAAYQRPELLWLVCPCLVYWISRAWLLAHRGEVTADPVAFAIRDRGSYAVIAALAAIYVTAS